NRALEISRGKNRYGSCGVGFGATVERHKQKRLQLFAADLFNFKLTQQKLQSIRSYYQDILFRDTKYDFHRFDHDREDAQLFDDLTQLNLLCKEGVIQLASASYMFRKRVFCEYIFEGAQGILLDQRCGNPPFITKSNTTSRNALRLLQQQTSLPPEAITISYVTRCYQTRHGNGPFEKTAVPFQLRNTRKETNRTNEFQGVFKTAPLNIEKLNHSLSIDRRFSKACKKELVITCLDQLKANNIPTTSGLVNYRDIPYLLDADFNRILFSFDACSEFIRS
ncbi:MAG: adenylosuccinate synthetase, partial [Sediminibacterium sp.]